MVKNIIFDFGGVVIHLQPEEAMRRFETLGITDARQQMNIFGQTGIFGQVEKGEITTDEFCRLLALEAQQKGGKFVGVDNPSYSYEEAHWAWMGYVKAVPRKNLDALLRLQQHYRLYLLSNLNPFLQQWAESDAFSGDGHGLRHYIPYLYYSFQLRDYKPAPSMFHRMMDAAGLRAEECVFVDDSPRNIEGCQDVGMRGLLVGKDEDWIGPLEELLGNI